VGGPFVFVEFGVSSDFGKRFFIVKRDGRPSADTVLLGRNGGGGVPAEAFFGFIKRKPSTNIKT
jgi:hypothetical protein